MPFAATTALSGFLIPVETPSTPPISLELHLPPGAETSWLKQVRRMRGEVIYDHGRRPAFLKSDGQFDDPDAGDLDSFHIVARCGDRVAGGVRLTAFNERCQGMVASAIGGCRLENQMREMGVERHQVAEVSRWTALPEYRGALGRRLAAASWALARWMGLQVVFVVAGTRERQDVALIRMGARPIPGVGLIPCEAFDDELRLIYFQVCDIPLSMRRHVEAAAAELNLNNESR